MFLHLDFYVFLFFMFLRFYVFFVFVFNGKNTEVGYGSLTDEPEVAK